MSAQFNIADRLRQSAQAWPFQKAVVFPAGKDRRGRYTYSSLTFQQLDQESDRLARGLIQLGVRPGTRMALMVRPGLEFIALTFAMFKAGAVIILIDPGMGRKNIIRCLSEVEPEGFVAIPLAQLFRKLKRRSFPKARLNVTVGKPVLTSGIDYHWLLGAQWTPFEIVHRTRTDPAAIIFTSGSTGPPKGVAYEHGMFWSQVDLLRDYYQIQPGEVDLPGFPLFALFNSAMGVTTVVPDMDPTKPARVDPRKIIRQMNDQGVTQAFGSPAMWNQIGRYCEAHNIKLPSLKRVLSAGAPVPVHVIERMRQTFTSSDADINTPYGATESLPVASIRGREVLEETSQQTATGAGTCVGTPFPGVQVKIIQIHNDPIASIEQAVELPSGEIGEIIVQGPMATREYFLRPEATRLAKIPDGERFWHRMGDVGYRDEQGKLWFCGRKAHMVETAEGPMFTICCEAIFNQHPRIYRSALVGVGSRPNQRPVIIVEPEQGGFPESQTAREQLTEELLELGQGNPLTKSISTVLFHHSLPVDIRHNVKIFREKLAPWAERQVG
ncbi:fatty acid CoA ligase family protein [Gimesia panareensis]|uniref:fatty acid CoA ligase family protein n=1 Tax=Gimesia panareensis TaxID=2527978 RepID=UPI00118C6149|nr:fatty acid CoA ligase family protein [Gimesia panareensis]QDU49663.1 Long-chain-fatty-acid--CoA ligase [Gimesia panareensis]